MRDSMVIYRGQVDALEVMSPEDFKAAFMAMADYALNGEIPNVDGIAKVFFLMAKPIIDNNNVKYENGKKGGRPGKNQKEPNHNQKEPNHNQKEPNHNQEKPDGEKAKPYVNVNDTVNVNEKCNEVLPDKSGSLSMYPYQEIVEYLNKKAGTSFRSSSKDTQKHIRARFNDGYSIEDFKRVIDNKVSEWINDTEMSQYLRPSTLFGTKFESYLNQKSIKHRDRNRFNNFHQREYDFEDLENRLLNTDETSVHEDEPP